MQGVTNQGAGVVTASCHDNGKMMLNRRWQTHIRARYGHVPESTALRLVRNNRSLLPGQVTDAFRHNFVLAQQRL
tara:strand:- start:148 stop:372 length:225 start_codon:yes stop_codon:yes gene_type:complete